MSIHVRSTIRLIRRYSRQYGALSDQDLKQRSLSLKYEAMTGKRLDNLVPQAFGLVTEAVRRTLGLSHYDVQLTCGIQLVAGHIAEMKTGEGKTLTAALPVFLHGLSGRGVHVATVNDYLAKRDHDELQDVYRMLGLTSGVIQGDDTPEVRAQAYRKDVTYASSKEFGFDFLRDQIKRSQLTSGGRDREPVGEDSFVQRPLNFVLVDEADSILIDEARTPLIIGMLDREEESVKQACYVWAQGIAAEFEEGIDFAYSHEKKSVELTLTGRGRMRSLLQNDLTSKVTIRELYDYVQNAIKVRRDFHLDQNYAVVDDEVVILDEFTGRPAEGRQWQGGIHQSVEAKEGVSITPATRQAAMVTVQSFFQQYRTMACMTGTAWTSRREFAKLYQKKVCRIPCHRPIQRVALPVKLFSSFDTKMDAVATEVKAMLAAGRSVLVGTRSVETSEKLSAILNNFGIDHRVLNARHIASEAEVVAAAGQPGAVTVATNMAGRGTDIKLHPDVKKAGGLHVIMTEIHDNERIDWQLIGRGARQGDPGSYRIFVAMDDEILDSGFGPQSAATIRKKFQRKAGGQEAASRSLFRFHRQAQKRVEHKQMVDRMILQKHHSEREERLSDTGQNPWLDVVS